MTQWTIFPAYLVRLAGFSFERLEPLRCRRAAQAAQDLDEAAAARAALGKTFDETLGQERYAENPLFDDPAVRKELARSVKQARSFARRVSLEVQLPEAAIREVVRITPRVSALADELISAHLRWQEAERAFAASFAEDFERARAALRHLYGDERMREAVFLESPEAFERIQQLLASDGTRNVRARQRERLAAMYAQRFCAKNDTNSLCGPHGVGYLTADATGQAGQAGVIDLTVEDARRQTYFSHWAAQRLLDEALRRAGEAAPVTFRLNPAARFEGSAVSWCTMAQDGTTSRRRYARSELPEQGLPILRAMDRQRTLPELRALAAEHGLDAAELEAFLEQLVTAGVVLRGPALATGLFYPLRAVMAEVTRWPASEARTWALDEIRGLEDLLERFSRATLDERLQSYPRMTAQFQACTGAPANRGEGRHYADRSILHEDRYVEVTSDFGAARGALDRTLPAMISVLELPLALGRERVREWFAARFGKHVRVSAIDVHRAFDDERVLETPAATPRAAAMRTAMERVRQAISRAVAAAEGGPARLTTEELHAALAELPAPTHAGYVSADVMLRRTPSGASELVLAEVHGFCWLPTCLLDVLPAEHRERVLGHMREAMRQLARGQTTAECMFTHTQATDRRFAIADKDLQILVPSDRPDGVDFGALDMRLGDDELEFWHGDEPITPVVTYNRYTFLHHTSRVAPLFDDQMDRFFPEDLLPEELRHGDVPRLFVDDVAFQRRTWRRPAAAVRAALTAPGEAELFRRGQALRRELGCEARVFASVSGEPKPILLDFDNPFLLEALANMLERQPGDGTVKFSEMLPGPDELVARGPDGARTSEIRMGFYRT